jgi:hypothetical protein
MQFIEIKCKATLDCRSAAMSAALSIISPHLCRSAAAIARHERVRWVSQPMSQANNLRRCHSTQLSARLARHLADL